MLDKLIDDEQFWNILHYEQWIIFQSFNRIYIYDTKTEEFNIISETDTILKAFVVNNAIYFHVINKGLFEIEKGRFKNIDKPDKGGNFYEKKKFNCGKKS